MLSCALGSTGIMSQTMFELIQILLLLCCFCCFGYGSEPCLFKKFVARKIFENILISDQSLWTRSGYESRTDCARDCGLDERCVSFFYNSQSTVCTAHISQFFSTANSVVEDGSRYYTLPEGNAPAEQDCAAILTSDPTTQDGVYTIDPYGQGQVNVYCDMTTDGGGWTVFQRRQNGATTFSRLWADYKIGFGDLAAEFWLGNDIISRLTAARQCQLRIDMLDNNYQPGYATYSQFSVESESWDYMLTISGYYGDVGDSMTYTHNNRMFSTMDRDNDAISYSNCAVDHPGGWWYNSCQAANLNGQYSHGVMWITWRASDIKWTDMKLKCAP